MGADSFFGGRARHRECMLIPPAPLMTFGEAEEYLKRWAKAFIERARLA